MNRLRCAVLIVLSLTACLSATAQQAPQRLTLQDAERIALANHPQIRAEQLTSLAVQQTVREQRSTYFPFSFGSLTAAKAETNSRIAAGALNNPIIYDRYANGLTIGQLITDFGRTSNLVQSSEYNSQSEEQNVAAKREDILLLVSASYYSALRSQAVLRVAQETVNTRQVLADQVNALAQSNLRSGLDVSFANVNLGQAKLLLVQAQNDLQAAFADLSTALGYNAPQNFELVEEPLPPAPSSDMAGLVSEALQNRPDLHAMRLKEQAAQRFARAERDLRFPSLSAVGSAGLIPARQEQLSSRYAAAGVNVNIPIFNGYLFSARQAEAEYRDQALSQQVRDLENRISRDVRLAWWNANTAFQQLDLTAQILDQANTALELAQSRYNLGLSSIVELSQAQLNKTQAEIQQAAAKYNFQSLMAALGYQVGTLR